VTESTGKPAKAIPGQPDMWVMVLFEALVFAAYFAVYLFHRSAHSELSSGRKPVLTLASGPSTRC